MAGFDAFLVPHERGADRRWSRLTVPERWCAVFGVEAIASKSPERGCLRIAEGVPAEAEDFAAQAGEGVTVAVARSTIKKMRDLGLIVRHDDGVECVADWHERQRDPKHKPSDSRESRRARKAAQRERERMEAEAAALVTPSGHADVTRDDGRDMSRGHAQEVKRSEVKENNGDVRAVPTAEELVLDRRIGTDAVGEREREDPDLAISGGTA